MSPLERLRKFFSESSTLKFAATQTGLARLVGRSETQVRGLERGRSRVTRKVADKLSALTGCDPSWLQLPSVDDGPIPGVNGEALTHDYCIQRITPVIGSLLDESRPASVTLPDLQRKTVECVLGMIETEISAYWQGDRRVADPMPELLDWLRKRAESRSSHSSHPPVGG